MRASRPSLTALAVVSLLVVPAVTLAADGSPGPSAPAGSPVPVTSPAPGALPLEGVQWHFREYRAEDGGIAGTQADGWIMLQDGSLSGSTGCNELSGSYTLQGDALTFVEITPTEAACLDGDIAVQEMALLGRLPDVTSFAFDDGDLWLVDAEGGRHLKFISLFGRTWVPVYGGAEPMPDGIVTLEFAEGGVSGQGPCNTYAGPFTMDGASIAIGPIESTRMACPDLDLENQFLSDLQLARSYAFAQGDLVLFDEQDEVLRTFAGASTGD
jgi:heat shock protein HslJ